MVCFIKNVVEGEIDDKTHSQFVKFGKGEYKNRAVLNCRKGSSIRLNSGSEYANDFVDLVSENVNVIFSGIILSKESIKEFLNVGELKKSEIYSYEVEGISSEVVKKISEKAYFMLLDAEGEGISLKIKKKLPKPGKSKKSKIDDKFCVLEAELKFWSMIKDAFLWDLPDFKKAVVSHDYIIDELIVPENEKDFKKTRVLAKRKGKLIRNIEVDGQKKSVERNFVA